MERFPQRENILLGYSPQRSFENSRKTSDTNSELDFGDVFGGPPRRFSIQETRTRYSFSETTLDSEEDTVLSRSPRSGLDEKPVFGAESVNRRPYPSGDFFDDIFKGDETKSYSSPRRTNRDVFASTPASRMLSPSRPLPPKAEPFSSSLPAQFSLPAKLTKATDFPPFGSINHLLYKNKDGISNEISYEHTSNSSPSRFSSQATGVRNETRNDRPLYRPSPLSNEVSHSSEESSYETKTDEKDAGAKLKNHSESKGVPLNSGQFHFSIYKWAGSGVQMLMPLGGRSKSRIREKFKTERCSSSNGRIENDSVGRHLATVEEHIISLDTEMLSLKTNNGRHDDIGKEKKIESCNEVEEAHPTIPEPKNNESEGHAVPEGEAMPTKKTKEESHLKNETNVYEKNEKETHMNKRQAPKNELKPLDALLNDENQGQGNATEGKENKVKVTNIANNVTNVTTGARKTDTKRINSKISEVNNTSLQSSAENSGDAFGRSTVKGKVKEFVKIFDKETSPKPKTDFDSHSSRWKGMDFNLTENGRTNAVKTDEKEHRPNKNKMPEFSSREDDNFNKNKVKQEPNLRSSVHISSGSSNNEKNASVFSDSLPNGYDNKVENRDESFQGYFLVEELSHVEDKDLQTGGESEEIQASNAKIQQWSNGRKGNIRSLLSTLQLVLWPKSGWKPVPLVDLIEGSAVKRAYQRALLCLHPDKLQQKGAASHQKYIAEKVFDILQEAWDHFNSLGAI